jgi:hypothetical protein
MNNSFLDILNDIKEKEFAFRDIYYESVNEKITHVKGKDALKSDVYGLVVGFLIYARYINLFDFRSVKDHIDIGVAIGKSSHPKKDKILALWNRLLNIEYPYYHHLLSLLADSKLSDYQNSENEVTLAKWNNQHFIFACNKYDLFQNYITSFEYKTIVECQSYLGIDLKHGNILVSIQEDGCLEHLMENNPAEAHITFYKCSRLIQLEISILMLQHYSNMEIIEDEEAEIFPFEDAQFDGVIIYRGQFYNEDFTLQLKDVLSFVKPGGFCVAFNQSREEVDEDFYKYQIPLMIDDLGNCVIVCKKSDDRDESVPYAFADIENNRTASNEAFEKWTFAIKNCLFDRTYQQLSKDDFRYNAKIDFQSVCRKPGEENFVWRNINDIISYKEYDKIGEWVFNTDFNKSQIVDSQILSDNPFQILADEGVYLKNYSNINLEGEHPLDACSIIEENKLYGYSIGERYIDIFKQTFNEQIDNEQTEKFKTQLCCRIVTSPLILYSPFNNKLIKIIATPSKPVCIRLYTFIFEEMDMPCPKLYCFKLNYNPIEINPAYDEQFIIYKLMKDINHDHILIAPTLEEQHTYFIYKQREYYSQFQKTVAEIENDICRRIEQYSSRIYGAGFENFRRFKRLPLLPLSGVNIMVGTNNAGKSTLVKGLLLALDNIKGLRVEHDDNIFSSSEQPLFRLDANNYHDVHIGTFNRAYSWQALQAEDMERKISFIIHIGKYFIEISIKQVEHDDTSTIPVSQIVISDERLGAKFDINYQTKHVIVNMNHCEEKIEYTTQLSLSHDRVGALLIPQLIRGIGMDAEQKKAENFPEFGLIKGRMGFIYEIADELEAIINNSQVEYVYAHGISQKALFDYNDHNDYMAQTLHDLVNEKIGKSERDFIKYWFGVFGIGRDYDVQSIAGEYYNIKILNDNNRMVNLADLGMGSNQLITLILRLAIFIHRQRIRGNTPYTPMIIIEEPEQNMHPAFQSKLADLFKDVYIKYGFCFIVETHSEYLVRRSQVIVAEQMFKDEDELKKNNPFKVYYFPADKNPYEMEYRTDGNFSNEFGKGFYDEASDLLFKIL